MDECTCFCEYDRPVNPRRWVSNGLNAYNVVVDELGMSGEGCDDVCGCRMSGELNGVRNGRRCGIVETARVQAVDLEKRPLDDVNDDGGLEHKA